MAAAVEAPNEKAAQAAAVAEFDLSDEQGDGSSCGSGTNLSRGLGQVSNILRRAILILLSVFLMTTTAHAQAEATAQEFLDKFEHADATERQTILILIKGLAEGVAWADTYKQSRGVARVYCPPGHFFSLQPEQLMDIFRRKVEARPVLRQEPWQRATIEALRNVFPCKRR